MNKSTDIIVIGAGINGLVAASYLAKHGRKVTVLEKRAKAGGAYVTEELYPGFHIDTCSHDLGWFNPAIVKELGLSSRFKLIPTDPVAVSPNGDEWLVLCRDINRSTEAIKRFSGKDAQHWPEFIIRVNKLAGFLQILYSQPAPDLFTSNLVEGLKMLNLGRKLRGLGKKDMVEFIRLLPMSVAEYMDDWFESSLLKGLLAARGLTNLMQGPRASGTAYNLLHHTVGQPSGVMRSSRRLSGGVGKLSETLATNLKQSGSEIRTEAKVERILIKDGKASGVVLASGEEVSASVILSTASPQITFLELIEPEYFDPSFLRAIRNIKYRGSRAKINLALDALPVFRGLDESHRQGLISISPSIDDLERAYDEAKYGGFSKKPYLEAILPSVTDPTIAPGGKHVMSIWMQYVPYHLKESNWDDASRQALTDSALNSLEQYAPGIKSLILYHQVLTPLDLEREFGASGGNIYHGELTLDQILFMRPVPGWAHYRTPVEGLYLGGSGAHPGGGLPGSAGRLAAYDVLKGP